MTIAVLESLPPLSIALAEGVNDRARAWAPSLPLALPQYAVPFRLQTDRTP